MNIYEWLEVASLVVLLLAAISFTGYALFMWWISTEEDHIEPIVPSYKNAKIGQVLSARK